MKDMQTNRLILRSLQPSDAERVEMFASDYEVAKTTLNIPHPYPKNSASDFIERSIKLTGEGTTITYAIVLKETNHLIGLIGTSITERDNRAELGYWIGKPYWGLGYATEATREILKFGFTNLNLNKITARALKGNPGSWRVMEKSGMSYEGTQREHVLKWEKYQDLVNYGMVKDDFKL